MDGFRGQNRDGTGEVLTAGRGLPRVMRLVLPTNMAGVTTLPHHVQQAEHDTGRVAGISERESEGAFKTLKRRTPARRGLNGGDLYKSSFVT